MSFSDFIVHYEANFIGTLYCSVGGEAMVPVLLVIIALVCYQATREFRKENVTENVLLFLFVTVPMLLATFKPLTC